MLTVDPEDFVMCFHPAGGGADCSPHTPEAAAEVQASALLQVARAEVGCWGLCYLGCRMPCLH